MYVGLPRQEAVSRTFGQALFLNIHNNALNAYLKHVKKSAAMSFGIGISLALTLKIQSAEANDVRDAVRITSRPKSESIF